MHNIRIAAASVNQTPLDWSGNRERLLSAIHEAHAAGAQIVNLPELAITGYGCEDMFFAVGVQRRALDEIAELLPHTKGMVVAVGLPLFYEASLYNAAALMVDGELAGIVCKQILASDGIHYEPRWFRPWPAGVVGQIEWQGRRYPMGDLLFDVGGVRIGFEICEDAWVAERPGGRLARRGRRHDPQSQRQPLRLRQAGDSQAVRDRRLAGVRRQLRLLRICWATSRAAAIYDGGALIASGGKMTARGRRLFTYSTTSNSRVADVRRRTATRLARGRRSNSRSQVERHGRHDCSSVVASTGPMPTPSLVIPRPSPNPGRRARTPRRRNSPGRFHWRCSTTCGRAARGDSWSASAAGPTRRPSRVLVKLMVRLGVAEMTPRSLRALRRAPAATGSRARVARHQRPRRPCQGVTGRCSPASTRRPATAAEATRNAARTRGRSRRGGVPRVRRRRGRTRATSTGLEGSAAN